MATEAVIGKSYTFQVLFLDNFNLPLVAVNPTINLFQYDNFGVRQTLVAGATMSPVVPPEDGRFVYVYSLPLSLLDGDNLHAEMEGLDPGSGGRLVTEQVVVAISATRGSGSSSGGLTSRFIK